MISRFSACTDWFLINLKDRAGGGETCALPIQWNNCHCWDGARGARRGGEKWMEQKKRNGEKDWLDIQLIFSVFISWILGKLEPIKLGAGYWRVTTRVFLPNIIMSNSNTLLAFKAGRAFRREGSNIVEPSPTKGAIFLVNGDDGLLHFQWKNRESGNMEEVRLGELTIQLQS